MRVGMGLPCHLDGLLLGSVFLFAPSAGWHGGMDTGGRRGQGIEGGPGGTGGKKGGGPVGGGMFEGNRV